MMYLKKRDMHRLASGILSAYGVPKCADCNYKAHGGYEWLTFYTPRFHIRFTVYARAKWARVVVMDDVGNVVSDRVYKNILCS